MKDNYFFIFLVSHCALLEDKFVIDAIETELNARESLKDARSWKPWMFNEALKLVKSKFKIVSCSN